MYNHIMDEVLPHALTIGVDYDLFWTLNPESLTPFVKAFSLKRQREDSQNWELGLYIRMAIGSSLDNKIKYPNKPMLIDRLEKEKETPEQRQEQILRNFETHVAIMNSKFEKEE